MQRIFSQVGKTPVSLHSLSKRSINTPNDSSSSHAGTSSSWKKWIGKVPASNEEIKWAVERLEGKEEHLSPVKIMETIQAETDRVLEQDKASRDPLAW